MKSALLASTGARLLRVGAPGDEAGRGHRPRRSAAGALAGPLDSYSAFFDNGHRKETDMRAVLREQGVTGCRGIDLAPGDVQRAVAEMRSLAVEVVP